MLCKIIIFIINNFKDLLVIFAVFIISILLISNNFLKNIKIQVNKNNKKEKETNKNNWIKNSTEEFLKNYLSIFNGKYDDEVLIDIQRIKKCFSLKILLKNNNSSINLVMIEKLRELFYNQYHKNFKFIKNIFIENAIPFGNRMIALNNIIYYSEILGIKKIFLNSDFDWYIKNDINTNKIHISVIDKSKINCNSEEIYCGENYGFFFPIYLKPERRLIILKEEIKRNLPKIKINKDDLYIYIRSGDSFSPMGNEYTPAPYCFYKKIISNFTFKDIYIISMDNLNPIINKLLSEYPSIIHQIHSVKVDLAIICNAYNLVNAVSSFSQIAISFNDNLINLFEYEVYKIGEKIYHLHYDFDKLDRIFNIYRMKPSEYYYIKMFTWRNTEKQRKLLFEEKCKYEFRKTNSNKTFFN